MRNRVFLVLTLLNFKNFILLFPLNLNPDKTAFMCPKCGSSIVIDFIPSASEPTATTASTSSTPLGSYNSSEGWMEKGKQKSVAKLTRMKSSDKFE